MKFLFIIFLFPLQLFAQDISGVWTGSLYNDTTKQYIHYELAINENNGKLSGYSHTTFIIDSIKNVGVKSVKIKKKDEVFLVEDEKLIYNNYPEPPAKGVKTFVHLTLSENDSAEVLSGSWNTNRTKEFSKLTGSVFLERKKKIKETLIVAKLEQMGLANKLSFISTEISSNDLTVIDKKVQAQNKNIHPANKSVLKNNEDVKSKIPDTIADPEISVIAANTKDHPGSSNKIITEKTKINGDEKSQNEVKIKEEKPKAAEKKFEEPIKELTVVTEKKPSKREKKALAINNQNEKIKKEVIEIPAAAEIATRKIETIKTVEIKHDSLVFTLYDNGTVDGDTVSVLINGKVIWPKVGLLARATNKTIYLTPEMGDSIFVVMYAENLGSIPPNTGLLVVRDGEKDYEIRFSGDLQKNSAIILKRKKKE